MERKELTRVIIEKDDAIGRIILNNPGKANAQDEAMVFEVDDCLTELERDWEIKVVIMKANGGGFCSGHAVGPAGADGSTTLPRIMENRDRPERSRRGAQDYFVWPVLRLWEFPKPTIAQVHGYCIGGGTCWGLVTDITIASEDAYFQMPLPQGLGFPSAETAIEPWVFMNWKRAYEYLYTSQTVDAKRAEELGMINRVVPREELEQAVEDLAAHIARAPLSTLMGTKTVVKRVWEMMGLRTHWQMSEEIMHLAGAASDVRAWRQERMTGEGGRQLRPREVAAQGGGPS